MRAWVRVWVCNGECECVLMYTRQRGWRWGRYTMTGSSSATRGAHTGLGAEMGGLATARAQLYQTRTSSSPRYARKYAAPLRLGHVGELFVLTLVRRFRVCALALGAVVVRNATPLALGLRARRRLDRRAHGTRARLECGLDLGMQSPSTSVALDGELA